MIRGCGYAYNEILMEGQVTLCNEELWTKFYEEGNEMIITKNGRSMFPKIMCKVTELNPHVKYCIYLFFELSPRSRHRYTSSGGWVPAGQAETQSNRVIYIHESSPATGEHWMTGDVSFGKVKLTNLAVPMSNGQVVLSSMHKYQPKIILVRSDSTEKIFVDPAKIFDLPITGFVAVTAYQNSKITNLKINHNPFAKGFRENGKSNVKKRQTEENPDSPSKKIPSSTSTSPSPSSSSSSSSLAPSSSHSEIVAERPINLVAVPFVDPRYQYPSYPIYPTYSTYPTYHYNYQCLCCPQQLRTQYPYNPEIFTYERLRAEWPREGQQYLRHPQLDEARRLEEWRINEEQRQRLERQRQEEVQQQTQPEPRRQETEGEKPRQGKDFLIKTLLGL